jgi:phospholipid-transporting ATPase
LTINGDSTAYEHLTGQHDNKHRRYIKDFFLLLAVCHTVMPEIDPKTGKMKYQASSPDELALVLGAAKMGFKFLERTSSNITIEVPLDGKQVWEVICEFPFDSTRKRMSLIVRNPVGEFYIMTKGADSIILPRIVMEKGGQQIVQKHLDQFAVDGLRTLVVGQKLLTQDTVEKFMAGYEAAKMMIGPEKDTSLNNLYDSLEKGLEMVGCTAIEDKLQDGVPETIATLLEADIRVWVLTGDKQVNQAL